MSKRGRGAMRSESSRRAILEATARLFGRHGYDDLTIEGIAAEARVGKQTIYRWWDSKSALIAECLLADMLLPSSLAPANTGDIEADLLHWLNTVSQIAREQEGDTLMRSLISAASAHPGVGASLKDAISGTSALTERLVGALILRSLNRDPIVEEEAARFVRIVIGRAPFDPAGHLSNTPTK